MTSILPLLLLIVFIGCFAMLLREGMWSNAITFFNVMTAAMLATNYFEPLADWLTAKFPDKTYFWDFLSLWGLFCVFMSLLRLATDKLSKMRVRFKLPVDWGGGIFFASWVGWLMVCFTTFSLHTAPLSRNFLFGAFQETPETKMFFNLGPDRYWLAWMHTMSLDGSLASSRPEGDTRTNVFDPDGDFIMRYGTRRKALEDIPDSFLEDPNKKK